MTVRQKCSRETLTTDTKRAPDFEPALWAKGYTNEPLYPLYSSIGACGALITQGHVVIALRRVHTDSDVVKSAVACAACRLAENGRRAAAGALTAAAND